MLRENNMTPQEITTLIKAITPNTPYKEYIPVVTTLIGVTVGFSLNYIRELVRNIKSEKLNTILLREELDIALEDSIDLARRICKSLDEEFAIGKTPIVYVSAISNVCFNEFYPTIIKCYSREQRRLIHECYSHILYINSLATKDYFAKVISSNINDEFNKINDLFISCLKLYRAHSNLYKGTNYKEISIKTYFQDVRIENEFYKKMMASKNVKPSH